MQYLLLRNTIDMVMPRFIFLLLLVTCNLAADANPDTLLVGGFAVGYSPPYLYSLEVNKTDDTYTDAIKKFSENKFERWGRYVAFTKGITEQAYWVMLKVRDTSGTSHKYLWSHYVTSCKYEFYELDSALQLLNHYSSSTYQPLKSRPYPVRSVSFPFTITGKQTKYLLLRAQATNTDVLFLDQDIATPEDFLQWEIGYTGLLNRYFGFFIFALIFNLLLFLFVRNKIYGWLSIYIFFLLVYNINDFNFDVLTFPEWVFNKFVLIPKFTWIIGATFSSLMVFNLFTNQKKHFPGWYRASLLFIRVLVLLFPVFICLHLFIDDHQSKLLRFARYVGYLFLSAAMLYQIINLLYISLKKNRAGLFFLLSSGPLILCAFIYFFYLATSIPIFVIWPSNVMNACGFEVILLTIIFIYDYRNKNLERNRLLEESLISERKITSAILTTQENERKRIAEDLHDELGSNLAALKLRLQKSELQKNELTDILKVVDKASADARNISHNLMPPEFEKTSLQDLLSNYYTKLNSESTVQFQFQCAGIHYNFSKEDELVIYRITMELTGNILKHSMADEATIQLIYYDNQLELMVEDNGKGVTESERVRDGIGLKNVQSRVNYLNGSIKIDSSSLGTTVIIQLPYKSK